MSLPKTYAEIVDQLGNVIPCYEKGKTGCIANDEANEEICCDGCLLLRIYEAGYARGMADQQAR